MSQENNDDYYYLIITANNFVELRSIKRGSAPGVKYIRYSVKRSFPWTMMSYKEWTFKYNWKPVIHSIEYIQFPAEVTPGLE